MPLVMIVDDTALIRSMIRQALAPERFEVVEASDGREAVALYQARRPDVVIMDIVMPDRSGIDTTREIIGLDPQAKVVMCSALDQEELVALAIDAGAGDFIFKPFQSSDILRVVEKALRD